MDRQYKQRLLSEYARVASEELNDMIEQHTAEQQPSSVKEYLERIKELQRMKSPANVQGGL